MWRNEELNKKAREHVRANAHVKGHPNLTSIDFCRWVYEILLLCTLDAPFLFLFFLFEFCRWVNETLRPNSTLEPGFPRKTGLETARKWLHHLRFEVLTARKGIFIGGHERDDVVESCKLFLHKMVKLRFLHFTNAPTEDAVRALPYDIDPPTNKKRSKTVVFFHDEGTFTANEDQLTQWVKEKEQGSRNHGVRFH